MVVWSREVAKYHQWEVLNQTGRCNLTPVVVVTTYRILHHKSCVLWPFPLHQDNNVHKEKDEGYIVHNYSNGSIVGSTESSEISDN